MSPATIPTGGTMTRSRALVVLAAALVALAVVRAVRRARKRARDSDSH